MTSFGDIRITTNRLILTTLRPEDAGELVGVLEDERLHEFIGGQPASRDELGDRYRRLAAGSAKPNEVWLNWIVRQRDGWRPIGTVQATVLDNECGDHAHIAWVIGVPWQNQGFASEAAAALVDWLRNHGVSVITAHIHPDHGASAKVAASVGLELTNESVDGEQVWDMRRDQVTSNGPFETGAARDVGTDPQASTCSGA